jgi:hypothetical protein
MSSERLHSNISLSSTTQRIIGLGATVIGSGLGVPQVSAVYGNSINLANPNDPAYSTSPFSQLRNLAWITLNDFRSRKGIAGIGQSADTRLDGASLLARKFTARAALLAGLSAQPGGAYTIFNRDGFGKFGYGWGDHGNVYALRNDFTQQSHVATRWSDSDKVWKSVIHPLSAATPFRGDKVNVIDYQAAGSLNAIYRWNTARSDSKTDFHETQDFIKFFFTGPKLAPHFKEDDTMTDDVIVFRATLGGISDTFNPQWNPVQLMGRADPNYHYTGYSRDMSLDFTVYATDRDELKPIYRKLNALAGYTTPDYSSETIGFKGPWMRITVGDLYNQMPVVISSLSYTLGDADSPWEINIEDDPTMMQVPLMVKVSIGFNIIGDTLPQKGGKFYSLAKRYSPSGSIEGSDNWLSDFKRTKKPKVGVPEDVTKIGTDDIGKINQLAKDIFIT